MTRKVWCVFQRLPGESCPALSAVCASREVADEVARMSGEDEREQGRPASAWTVGAWGVLEEVGEMRDAQRISDALDPLRAGAVPPAEPGDEAADRAPAGTLPDAGR